MTNVAATSTLAHDIVLECRGLSHWFGRNKVLYDIDLKIVRGEIVALVGPSGCGKSTLLRAILGTHPPRAGEVFMNGTRVTAPGRDRGIVYQRYSLFPFHTAQENVAFGLMVDQTDLHERFFLFWKWLALRKRHMEQAAGLLDKLKLGASLQQYPSEMSGGMRQRVAIAQALIMKPQILLLDEPFGALDEATREELQDMLLELYEENVAAKRAGRVPPYTIVIVTHELNEAILVADRVLGLSQYWDWEKAGLAASPGATITYDSVAPVLAPRQEPDYETFRRQREELRRVAFEPRSRAERGSHLRFWDQVAAGEGGGVLASTGVDAA